MEKASELIRQGRRAEVWRKYCGFLDLLTPRRSGIEKRSVADLKALQGQPNTGQKDRAFAEQPSRTSGWWNRRSHNME